MALGMRSDPERIQRLIEERERRERAARGRPMQSFDDVLEEQAAEEAEVEVVDPGEAEEAGAEAAPEERELPRVPPDPRVAALHALVEGKRSRKKRGKL